MATPIFLAPQIAKAEGFFAEQGLAVNFVTVTSGAAIVAGLAGGSLQVGPIALSQAAATVQKSLNLRAVAAQSNKYSFALLVPQGSSLTASASLPWDQRLRALKGKTIGYPAGRQGSIWPFFAALLKKAGLDPDKDVTVVNVPFSGPQLAALQGHQVDVTLGDQTTETSAIAQKIASSYFNLETDPPADFRNLLIAAYFTPKAFLAAHPDFGAHYSAALAKAYAFIMNPKNSAEVVKVAVNDLRLPASPEIYGLLTAAHQGLVATLPQSDLDRSLQFIFDSGQAPLAPAVSSADFYSSSIVAG